MFIITNLNQAVPPSFIKAHPQYAYRPDLKEYLESLSDIICYKELEDGLYAVIRVHQGHSEWSKHIAGGPRSVEAAAGIRARIGADPSGSKDQDTGLKNSG